MIMWLQYALECIEICLLYDWIFVSTRFNFAHVNFPIKYLSTLKDKSLLVDLNGE